MLKGVAADDVAHRENLPVGFFENFGEDIEADHYGEIGAARVVRGKEEHEQQNQKRTDLHRGIEAKIAVAVKLSGAPYQHAANSHDLQNGKEREAHSCAHAFGDYRC